ncbi:MAG: hypothetical protein H6621_08555 [Halobacteriovoraceae bacterium]|nr:hypothetical protein [Halobacteriovoraceae bacterium]MCB9095103.1 hypothetical protein [Halobacteriovoraceae bacterium]
MKKWISSIFENLNKKTFSYITTVFCFSGDLIFIIFIKFILLSDSNIKAFIFENSPPSYRQIFINLSAEEQMQFITLFVNTINLFIMGILLLNVLFYSLFLKDKKWGILYIKDGTALLGFLFSIVTFYEALSYSAFWAIVLLALTPGYIYVYLGMRHFYPKKIKS